MEDKIKMLKEQMSDLIDRLTKEENEYQKMVKEYERIDADAIIAMKRFETVAIATMLVDRTEATWANMLAAGAKARPDLREDLLNYDSERRQHEMRVEAQKQRIMSLRLLLEINKSLLEMETK